MDQVDNEANSVILYHLQFRATQGMKLEKWNHGNNWAIIISILKRKLKLNSMCWICSLSKWNILWEEITLSKKSSQLWKQNYIENLEVREAVVRSFYFKILIYIRRYGYFLPRNSLTEFRETESYSDFSKYILYLSAQSAITKLHSQDGLNQGSSISSHTGGEWQVIEWSFICVYSHSPSLALLPKLHLLSDQQQH